MQAGNDRWRSNTFLGGYLVGMYSFSIRYPRIFRYPKIYRLYLEKNIPISGLHLPKCWKFRFRRNGNLKLNYWSILYLGNYYIFLYNMFLIKKIKTEEKCIYLLLKSYMFLEIGYSLFDNVEGT